MRDALRQAQGLHFVSTGMRDGDQLTPASRDFVPLSGISSEE